jgi:hypothetical protein
MDSVVLIVLALLVGLWAGGSFARFNRARTDLRGAKVLVTGARRKRAVAAGHSLRAGLVLAFLIVVFVMGLRAAGKV